MLVFKYITNIILLYSVSYYQPLRSAVEHIPFEEDEEFDSRPVTAKQRFMKVVKPKRNRQSKAVNLAAYVIPAYPYNEGPERYRSDSPYQEIVDVKEFEQLQMRRMQNLNVEPIRSKLSDYKVICHVTNWSFYRKGEGKFVPENIDTSLCTHIIYAFASLDPQTLKLKEFDPWGDIENGLYQRAVKSSGTTPVLLAIGGWTDSTGDKYSKLVSNSQFRQQFIQDSIGFLLRFGFSGLHIDWNYPVCWQSDCRAGPKSDKDNFTKFIQVLT